MSPKRKKDAAPAAPPPGEVSGDDRLVLTGAYKAGLILAWKRDTERGYCLTLAGKSDEYVGGRQAGALPRKAQSRGLTRRDRRPAVVVLSRSDWTI